MIQDKIFLDEKDPTGLSYNTPFTVYGSYQGRLWSKTPSGSIQYYSQNSDLSAYATTGSNQFNGSQTITGSLTVTGGISGSSAESASYALNADKIDNLDSTQLVLTSSFNSYTSSASSSVGSFSSSVATTTSGLGGRITTIEGNYATTGSNIFLGSQVITGSICSNGNIVTTGQIVAQTINVQQVTSSIVYSCGSNIFGTDINNTQTFTGSMFITGSNIRANVGNTCFQGSVCAPSVITNGVTINGGNDLVFRDSSNYVSSPATDTLRIVTANSERIRISPTGISCFACQVCAAGAVLSANLSGTNANFSSYVSVGSLVVNDPGAAYYSYTNRIGGSTAINVSSLNVTTELGKFLSSGLSINSVGGATNNMYQISFGYKDVTGVFASSAIAGISESSSGYNTGAIVFATRSATTDTAPVERLRISSTGVACFSCQVCAPSFMGGTVTGTRMTVATDCSGVIVDVASRHGLMKYFNYSTGLVGACSGTDGNISIWLGRFTGSITAPTAVYQDLVITNTGIACFSCRVCAPSLTISGDVTINGTSGNINYFPNNPKSNALCTTLLGSMVSTDLGYGPQFRFAGATSGEFIDIGQNKTGGFVIETTDTPRLTVTQGGNVGIGTLIPEVSFVVKGTSIGSGGKASFYGGGDENNWSAVNNEAIRIGRADILNGFYSSIWSASGSGGNELQHWLKFYISNGSNAQTLALTMFGNGNVEVAGALSKGSGSFRICHPLTSKKCTHQLVHSFIEGPQADLIYRGKVNLINGIACVNIDCAARMTEGTFEALNRCVQVFTTNESSWDAVRGKVQENILVIESQNNTSIDEISWMVIGERQDEHMFETNWTDQEGRVITEPEIF